MSSLFTAKYRKSVVIRSLKILPGNDKPKIIGSIFLQICIGFLDLLGVAGIGVLGALAVTGVQSQSPGNRVHRVLELLGVSNFSFQTQAALIALISGVILILRTILSVFITKRIFYFLGRRGALISTNLVSRLLSQSLLQVQSRSTQDTVYALTVGVSAITLGILAASMAIIADSSLLIIIVFGLFVVDAIMAIVTIIFFGILGFILYKLMSVKAHRLGFLNSQLSIESNQKIVEVLDSYRESVVRNRRDYYARQIGSLRYKFADISAEMQFMPNVSKYVIESGIVIGALVISGIQFGLQDASHAIATLSVFLAAGTRIAPAIMRLQQSMITVKNSVGSANPTLQLIDSLKDTPKVKEFTDDLIVDHKGFKSNIEVDSISLKYPNQDSPALIDLSLNVSEGTSLAIVGPSGAGKTSLVDIILGVLPCDTGSIKISGKEPLVAIEEWPGAISYVPQDVTISNGTIRSNVSLGYPIELALDEIIWSALEIAQLASFVRNLPNKLDTPVGEYGTKLSGGQRQRLGIARAMFTKPKLLVLDEATSSLDGQTESDVSGAIKNLKGTVTVIMIAHRLSTVRGADQVVYMAHGKILARGTFEEVRGLVPDFDSQAQLMGL